MKNPYDRLSRAISYALHPLIAPTIAALLLLFGPTVMSNLPAEARWFIAAVILLNTLILPAFSLAVLKLFGGLSDLRLQSQRQRMLPMGIVAVCYMLCILSFRQMTVAFLVDRFLIAALCCVVIAFVVNLYWKISLHMTAAGGLLGMMIVMNYTGLAQFRTFIFISLSGTPGFLCGNNKDQVLILGRNSSRTYQHPFQLPVNIYLKIWDSRIGNSLNASRNGIVNHSPYPYVEKD